MVSSIAPSYLPKQLLSWFIGLIAMQIGRQISPQRTYIIRWYLFIISCVLLLLSISINNITRGSRRWLDIGQFSFQPSEASKPLLMLFLSHEKQTWLLAIPVLIILWQPDLGSAMSVALLITPLVLFNPKILKLGLIFLFVLAASSPLIWAKMLHDYQKQRIVNFLDPSNDPLGQGYNVIQSKIAVGSGGLFGRGYKKGTQGQLLFLPEKHTDFIISATAEETGFLGIFLVLAAYFVLLISLLKKTFSVTNNRPLFLFTLGVTIQIWAQTFINIGMNLGLLPVTGIPLPFLSVGGSSIISLLFSIGIINSN